MACGRKPPLAAPCCKECVWENKYRKTEARIKPLFVFFFFFFFYFNAKCDVNDSVVWCVQGGFLVGFQHQIVPVDRSLLTRCQQKAAVEELVHVWHFGSSSGDKLWAVCMHVKMTQCHFPFTMWNPVKTLFWSLWGNCAVFRAVWTRISSENKTKWKNRGYKCNSHFIDVAKTD